MDTIKNHYYPSISSVPDLGKKGHKIIPLHPKLNFVIQKKICYKIKRFCFVFCKKKIKFTSEKVLNNFDNISLHGKNLMHFNSNKLFDNFDKSITI